MRSSGLDALDFDIYAVANRAPITGAGRAQLACFFRSLSFNAPWLLGQFRPHRGFLLARWPVCYIPPGKLPVCFDDLQMHNSV